MNTSTKFFIAAVVLASGFSLATLFGNPRPVTPGSPWLSTDRSPENSKASAADFRMQPPPVPLGQLRLRTNRPNSSKTPPTEADDRRWSSSPIRRAAQHPGGAAQRADQPTRLSLRGGPAWGEREDTRSDDRFASGNDAAFDASEWAEAAAHPFAAAERSGMHAPFQKAAAGRGSQNRDGRDNLHREENELAPRVAAAPQASAFDSFSNDSTALNTSLTRRLPRVDAAAADSAEAASQNIASQASPRSRPHSAYPTTEAALAMPFPTGAAEGAVRPRAREAPSDERRTESARRTHIVVDGDTLQRLAERYLDDPQRSWEIYSLNRAALPNPELLPIGMVLKIPPKQEGVYLENNAGSAGRRDAPAASPAASAASGSDPSSAVGGSASGGMVPVAPNRATNSASPEAELLRPMPVDW